MSRQDKRAGRVKYKGQPSEDINRAIYGEFAGHPILNDLNLALGLGFVVHEGDWSPKENVAKVEIERTRAGLRVGRFVAGLIRRGDVEGVGQVARMAKHLKEKRWEAVDPLAYEILTAQEDWWRQNRTPPSAKDLARLIDEKRARLGVSPLDVSLNALTMQMIRKKVLLKGKRRKAGRKK